MNRRGLFRFLAAAPAAVVAPAVVKESGLTKVWREMLDAGAFRQIPGMVAKSRPLLLDATIRYVDIKTWDYVPSVVDKQYYTVIDHKLYKWVPDKED